MTGWSENPVTDFGFLEDFFFQPFGRNVGQTAAGDSFAQALKNLARHLHHQPMAHSPFELAQALATQQFIHRGNLAE